MTRNEQNYYNDVSSIEKSLKRIASALENSNVTEDDDMDNVTEHETNCDYLSQLVQNLDSNDYLEFCNEHCLVSSDAVQVTNYIYDLDYDECLGAIKDLESKTDYSESKSDDQANEEVLESDFHTCNGEKDPYTYEPNPNRDKGEPALTEYKDGVTYDDDYDIRIEALHYQIDLKEGKFNTKKECILDYVDNAFGSNGARYTDIIKFAYYLGAHNAPKYSYENRGYYSLAMAGGRGHLTKGGNDYFVKGINKEGNERYFALSFVESVTDYWKYIK